MMNTNMSSSDPLELITSECRCVLIAGGLDTEAAQLESYLQTLGYTTQLAADLERAKGILETNYFDLMILDVRLPGGSSLESNGGIELIQFVQNHEDFKHMPVIVFGEDDDADLLNECADLGVREFLPRTWISNPRLGTVMVRELIRSALDQKRMIEREQDYLITSKLITDLTQVILPLGISLSAEKDLNRLLEKILLQTRALCNADAGTIYLRTEIDTLRFVMVYTQSLKLALGGTTGNEINFPDLRLFDDSGKPNYRNVATYAALNGTSINIADVYSTEDEFDFTGSRAFDQANNYQTVSSLTVPMKDHDEKVIGVLQLINAIDSQTNEITAFNKYMQQVAESLASQAAVALQNQLLLAKQKHLAKMEEEMEIARKIQADFLPSVIPQPEGWEVAAFFDPAREVAGDFYDAFVLPGNHICFTIADVCDKGVGAALFMALIRSLLRAFSVGSARHYDGTEAALPQDEKLHDHDELVVDEQHVMNSIEMTNDYVVQNHMQINMFATAFFGVLDPISGVFTYINAGHNPPVVFNVASGIKERLKPTGPAVGMFPDTHFDYRQVQLDPGDFLLTFTDGVPDARTPAGELFTEKRLLALLEEPVYSSAALVSRIQNKLREHVSTGDQADDITILALYRKPQ